MWFEDRSLSNMKISSLIVEEWRDIWPAKPEFMFAALAYLFATTNFLNFPRLILDNGGPAFLVAYGASLLVIILPILILELAVGQLTGRGPVQAFYNICPAFKGIGISQIVFSLFILATMSRFLAWIFFYIYHLFWTLTDDRPGLPWLHCKNFPEFQFGDCVESASSLYVNNSAYTLSRKLATFHENSALSQFTNVLDSASDSIAQVGQFQTHWLIAFSIIWAMVFMAICFGVKWLGKVIMFSLFVPLVLLLGLCGRATFLGGAIGMFDYFFTDALDWERLKDWIVWKTAAEQAILGTGIGFGAFITLGSYNKRSNNLVQNAFLLLIGHILISALQTATIIALIGHISFKTDLSPSELLEQGENQFFQMLVYLAFIPHTKIFTGMLLFLFAFVLLNIFYILALGILATFEDALGEKWSRCFPRFTLALFICLIGMASTLFFATQAGKHGYELVTGYLKYITLALILAFELFAVAWIYCAHSLGRDLKTMLDSTCCWCFGHFLLFFNYLLPAVPITIAVVNLMGYSYEKYSPEIRVWSWSELVGLGIALIPLMPIPIWAIMTIWQSCRHGARSTPCRSFCLAFRSPLHYDELMKGSTLSGGTHHRMEKPNHQHYNKNSSRYTSAGSYMLLPQAPLAQPESDDVVPGSARHHQQQQGTQKQQETTITHTTLMNTSTASTLRADSASDGRIRTLHNTHSEGAFV